MKRPRPEQTQNYVGQQRFADDFRRIFMSPSSDAGMPGLIVCHYGDHWLTGDPNIDAETMLKFSLMQESEAAYSPSIVVSWKEGRFVAFASLQSPVERALVRGAIDRSRFRAPQCVEVKELALNHFAICAYGFRMQDLERLAPAVHMMFGVVFRDAWLAHLIMHGQRWHAEILRASVLEDEHGNPDNLRSMIISVSSKEDSRHVHMFVSTPTSESGFVDFHTLPTREYPDSWWRQRFMDLEINGEYPNRSWRKRVMDIHSAPRVLRVQPYQMHADVARVLRMLKTLLLSP